MSVPWNSIFLSIDAVPEDAFVCDEKVGIGKWNIPENRDSDMYFVNFLPEYL